MPLELPNLDDRTYNDLVAEALSMIPTYAPEWTNYNPSDPGITLIELSAYLTELLIYRLNRVTDANKAKFLKLLVGPDTWETLQAEWKQLKANNLVSTGGDILPDTSTLNNAIEQAVSRLRQVSRAVTCKDYEDLTTTGFNQWLAQMQQQAKQAQPLDEWWKTTKLEVSTGNLPTTFKFVQRAHCVARRNLQADTVLTARPGHISVLVLSGYEEQTPPKATFELDTNPVKVHWKTTTSGVGNRKELLNAISGFLEPRRLLTTRVHVVFPRLLTVGVKLTLHLKRDALFEDVGQRAIERLREFFQPLPNKQSGRQGWTLGRAVYLSEIYQVLDETEGVDYVTRTGSEDELYAISQPDRRIPASGPLVGIALQPDELVSLNKVDLELDSPVTH